MNFCRCPHGKEAFAGIPILLLLIRLSGDAERNAAKRAHQSLASGCRHEERNNDTAA